MMQLPSPLATRGGTSRLPRFALTHWPAARRGRRRPALRADPDSLRAAPFSFQLFSSARTPLPYRLRPFFMGIRHVYFVGDSGMAAVPAGRMPQKIAIGSARSIGQRRPRRAAGYWIMAIIEIGIAIAIEIEKTEPSNPTR